ncbi:MAG: DUF61 family protein [Acidilobaceae archaeon]
MIRDKLREAIERKYREDIRKLSIYWPSETITLLELAMGKKNIRLYSNDIHEFDDRDIKLILEITPRYFWLLMRVPLMLRYKRESDGTAKYIVEGGIWQMRLAELMVRGQVSSSGLKELDVSQFSKLISRFKSLVFITLEG